MKNTPNNSISLNKFISNTGKCSRREADKLIEQKRIKINGKLALLGNRVAPGDRVTLDGKLINVKAAPTTLYLAFNKPIGIVCTTDPKERQNIIQYINHPQRLFPIGRLDKPSQGLIFLTNDGDIVNKILRAGNNHEKEYIVSVKQIITPAFIEKMSEGIPILGTRTKKCSVTKINERTFKIILTQGLNRQIRRMCEYLNYEVVKLNRTRIMNVNLGKLPIGEWRTLTKTELTELNQLIANSSKTQEASLDKNKIKKRNTPKVSSKKTKAKKSGAKTGSKSKTKVKAKTKSKRSFGLNPNPKSKENRKGSSKRKKKSKK